MTSKKKPKTDNEQVHKDELHSSYSAKDINRATWWRLKRAAARQRCRIQNLVVDFALPDCQVTSFNLIILSTFPVQQKVTRRGGRRRMRSKTARAMATWTYYKFQQRLVNKAREYKPCNVVLVSEAYTTTGRCGSLNDVGSSKEYACKKCQFECHQWCEKYGSLQYSEPGSRAKSTQELASTRCRHIFAIIVVMGVARDEAASFSPEYHDPSQFPTKYACLFSRKHTSVRTISHRQYSRIIIYMIKPNILDQAQRQ
ncbi:hypothetical protein V1520DRAFT_345595 [Lipomyces starkeyi]|uniref:Cas12f1-like TNB domain-containing protein n=1 Tax=Lipomyces starkeyi NRRL Y-11557 TaxID=675824 RepID=A0A1E3Q5Q7_LIPST|nr:hypothetical protein LIPSTDRAFT_278411 [Lipomyces starkeyi NRRL Y-11557]